MLSAFSKRPIGLNIHSVLLNARPIIPMLLKSRYFEHVNQSTRALHVTSINSVNFKNFSNQGPRFNRGPPSSSSLLFSLIPDGAKALLTVMGVSAFVLFFAGPLLIITVPPLIAGGYIWTRIKLAQRSKAMNQRWEDLLQTHLTYRGSELDQARVESFVLGRVLDAFRQNEQGILEQLGLAKQEQYHTLDSRLELGPVETIDQDFQISRTTGIKEHITVMSFGLHDLDSGVNLTRIATVVVTLKPKQPLTTLLDVSSTNQDAVIEVRPLLKFKKPVILKSESQFKEPPSINLSAKR